MSEQAALKDNISPAFTVRIAPHATRPAKHAAQEAKTTVRLVRPDQSCKTANAFKAIPSANVRRKRQNLQTAAVVRRMYKRRGSS